MTDITIPPAAPPPWPDGFYKIERSIMDCCATEGCGQVPSMRLEIGGTASVYCEPCARKIAAIQARKIAVDADLTIPPAALEAVAQHLWALSHPRLPWRDGNSPARIKFRTKARTACLAMLRAWPSKTIHNDHLHWPQYPHIILPLPQENTND